jgi:hypothetical protein
MIPGWLISAADEFWAVADRPAAYPRDLTLPAFSAFVIDLQLTPGLRISGIEEWFKQRACEVQFGQLDRRLRGCLTAVGGAAVIFADGADDAAEHRFTVAHELSHFLVDYLLPRNKAIAKLGPEIAEVLDGVRAPTDDERLDAAINACPLGLHIHLLERRDPTGRFSMVESRADKLAWELLAPDEELERRFGSEQLSVAELTHGLVNEFGLPMPEAAKYATQWTRARQGPAPLIRLV